VDVKSSTVLKLRATIHLTRDLSSGDFPHSHSRDALLHIGAIFETGLARVESLADGVDPAITRALCASELRRIFSLYPILGFLLRSTDVRNAFEIHGPFLRIIQKVLGPDSKLVISSEWDFSPFTFLPPSEFALHDTVLIGVPTSEASNALLIPLAGHELGHNIWAKQKWRELFGPLLADAVVEYITKNRWREFSEFFPHVKKPEFLKDLVGQQSWAPAWTWTIRQCEELFCDFIGLSIFRESFAHASSYLLSPGLPVMRSVFYPGSKQRAIYLKQAADKHGIPLPTDYVDRFDNESEPTDQPQALLLSIADHATSDLVPQLIQEADDVISGAGIAAAGQDEIDRLIRCLSQCVPPQHAAGLPAIVNAAWQFYLSGMEEWNDAYPDIAGSPQRLMEVLSDLVLKTIEVYEIDQRQL
jgi:hypothetical protein